MGIIVNRAIQYHTLQEVFDAVWKIAQTMKEPSLSEEYGCAYRAADGRKCLFGHLIPNENYHPIIEGSNIESEVIRKAALISPFGIDVKALAALQCCHDDLGNKHRPHNGLPLPERTFNEDLLSNLRHFAFHYNVRIPTDDNQG